jgi:hypothetical protein
LLSDFICRCCLQVDESRRQLAHRTTTNAACEIAPAPYGAKHALTESMTMPTTLKEIERKLSLATSQYRVTELLLVGREDFDALSAA